MCTITRLELEAFLRKLSQVCSDDRLLGQVRSVHRKERPSERRPQVETLVHRLILGQQLRLRRLGLMQRKRSEKMLGSFAIDADVQTCNASGSDDQPESTGG
jgi:hypothetical protein